MLVSLSCRGYGIRDLQTGFTLSPLSHVSCCLFVFFSVMDVDLKQKQHVLVLWSGHHPPKDIEEVVGHYNKMVGQDGKVSLEHSDRLHMGEFHVII